MRTLRMGPPGERATVQSTAQFFLDMDAPKCCAKMMELKDEMNMAVRNDYMQDHAQKRMASTANLVSESTSDPFVKFGGFMSQKPTSKLAS
jgi:hypothetical protein